MDINELETIMHDQSILLHHIAIAKKWCITAYLPDKAMDFTGDSPEDVFNQLKGFYNPTNPVCPECNGTGHVKTTHHEREFFVPCKKCHPPVI
jgi:hypothetical protein